MASASERPLFPLNIEPKEQLEREPQDSLLGVSEQSCLLLNCFKWHLLSKELHKDTYHLT